MSKSNTSFASKTLSVKIVLVGPSNAGKTSIAKRFATDHFDEFQDMTVGSAFFSKQLHSSKHQVQARVEVWDTAGQEKYRAMAPMYFRNAAGALLVFDLSSPSSFDDIENIWLPELLPHMKNSTQFIVMCGNKADSISEGNEATSTFLSRVSNQCAARGIRYFATSAKNGQNVAEVFSLLVDGILEARARDAQLAKEKKEALAQPVFIGATTTPDNSSSGATEPSKLKKCCSK